jgi:hypothetical protein
VHAAAPASTTTTDRVLARQARIHRAYDRGERVLLRGANVTRDAVLHDLHATLAALGDDEVRVVALVAKRLAIGRKCYGPLDIKGDRRDWRHEASEELLDGCVYLAAETLRREVA